MGVAAVQRSGRQRVLERHRRHPVGVGPGGGADVVVEALGVDAQPLAAGEGDRGAVGAHEERGLALGPPRFERGEQVVQGDPQVVGRGPLVEVGPQVGDDRGTGRRGVGDEVRQQGPHPPAPQLTGVRTAVGHQLQRAEDAHLGRVRGRGRHRGQQGRRRT